MKAQWWSRISWRALKLRWVNLASLKYILSTFCFSEFPCRGGSDKKIQNDLCRFYRSYYYLELWSVFAETLIACFGYIPICVEEGFACSNICVVWQYIPRSLLKYFFWFTADISSDYKKTWYARYPNRLADSIIFIHQRRNADAGILMRTGAKICPKQLTWVTPIPPKSSSMLEKFKFV